MRNMRLLVAVSAALALAVSAQPAAADNYTAKQADGTVVTFCSRAITSVNYTCQSAVAYSMPDASGSVTTGGAFQQVFGANTTRFQCYIHNPTSATEPLYVFAKSGATASTDNSDTVGPGATWFCGGNGTITPLAVQVTAATTGHKFDAGGQ